jgi:hypothetical protein
MGAAPAGAAGRRGMSGDCVWRTSGFVVIVG